MTNETLETIKRRRSVRAFLPGQLSKDEVQTIVEAGLYAPHGGGEAWHFAVVQNAGVLSKIDTLAKQYALDSGLPWLQALGQDAQFHSMYHAPTVVFVAGDAQNVGAIYDTSAATQNLLLAAQSLGIGSCWGYFATQAFLTPEGENLKELLNIPSGYTVYTSVMLGYPANTPDAPPRGHNLISYIE